MDKSKVARFFMAHPVGSCVSLLHLIFGVGRLFHLPRTEAISVWPNAHPQKVKVTEGYVNGCKAVNGCEAEIGIKAST